MQQEIAIPVDLKVLMNHIYEYKNSLAVYPSMSYC